MYLHSQVNFLDQDFHKLDREQDRDATERTAYYQATFKNGKYVMYL